MMVVVSTLALIVIATMVGAGVMALRLISILRGLRTRVADCTALISPLVAELVDEVAVTQTEISHLHASTGSRGVTAGS
jgi:hypothetical protein